VVWSRASRHERGYGSQWDKLRLAVLQRDMYLCCCDECAKLGRIRPATEVDHYIPKAKLGTDSLDNLRAINAKCHKAKTDRENGRTPRKTAFGPDGWPGG
jgi:5-methylcytosine-specific restriction protein A